MDDPEVELIKRVLAEHGIEPERALFGLLRTLAGHHFASRLRRPAPTSRQLSLVSLLDPNAAEPLPRPTVCEEVIALLQIEHRNNAQAAGEQPRGDLAKVQAALLHLLADSLAVGEHQADEEGDEGELPRDVPTPRPARDDEERPPMRLVRD
jgi:hypothetical protein